MSSREELQEAQMERIKKIHNTTRRMKLKPLSERPLDWDDLANMAEWSAEIIDLQEKLST